VVTSVWLKGTVPRDFSANKIVTSNAERGLESIFSRELTFRSNAAWHAAIGVRNKTFKGSKNKNIFLRRIKRYFEKIESEFATKLKRAKANFS